MNWKSFFEGFAVGGAAIGYLVHRYYARIVDSAKKALLNIETNVENKFKKVL